MRNIAISEHQITSSSVDNEKEWISSCSGHFGPRDAVPYNSETTSKPDDRSADILNVNWISKIVVDSTRILAAIYAASAFLA